MRRTPRTEFADARSAAVEARKAMLERVGLRQAETEPEPAGSGDVTVSSSHPWSSPRSDPWADIRRAFDRLSDPAIWDPIQNAAAAARYFVQRYAGIEASPADGLMPDAYRGGQRASVHAMYDPITWPDEGYPCQLCWSAKRWPWEPMRSCPVTVDVESTYCENHGGKAEDATGVWVDAGTIENLSAPTLTELTNGGVISGFMPTSYVVHHYGAVTSRGLMQVINPPIYTEA